MMIIIDYDYQMVNENWVCLKMLCTPKNPMVLLIIIPFLKMAMSLGILTHHFQTKPYIESMILDMLLGDKSMV